MIRNADPARDAAACAAIYAPFVTRGATSFEEQAPSAREMAARIEQALLTHAWLVVELDGEVAGYAYAGPHRQRPGYRWTVESSIYVARRHRGRGTGRRLLEALLQTLAGRGFHSALAGITLPNEASVRIHERCGYHHLGTFREVGFKAGAWRDVGWWQRILEPE